MQEMYEGERVIKIQVEAYGEKMVLEFPSDTGMEGMVDKFKTIATFLTFAPQTIADWLDSNEEEVSDNTN